MLRFQPKGTLLASTAYDSLVNLWDCSGNRLYEQIHLEHGITNQIEFSKDGTKLLVSLNSSVMVYEVGEEVNRLYRV